MQEDLNAFVGGLSGVFKGFKITNSKGVHNLQNLQKLKEITERNEVTVLNWASKSEEEILVGYNNQLVKIYDLKTNTFNAYEGKKAGDGPVRGVFKLNSSIVTGVESGVVAVWGEGEEASQVVETGGPLSCMQQSPVLEHIIGTGGKENDLKLWDLETGKTTFVAKNVRHDELELRVPVWVQDLAFLPDSKKVAVATRYGHVRLYDPSTPTRRPVRQVTVKDHSFTCIANTPREQHVLVGCTTGNMYLVDLRGKGLLLNKYKGFIGSVRQIACPSHEPYVVSVSLDRHLRVHHLDSKKLLFKEYMQSRLSALLLKSDFSMEVKEEPQDIIEENYGEYGQINPIEIKDEEEEENGPRIKPKKPKTKRRKPTIDESEEEYERLFDEMEVVSEKQNKEDNKSKSKVKTKKKRLKRNAPEIISVN